MEKTMTLDDFVQLAIKAGRTIEWVERNARGVLFGNNDLTVHVGSEDIVVPIASIKDYFERKNPPTPEIAATPSPLLSDFMADVEVPPPPAVEVKKSGGKK